MKIELKAINLSTLTWCFYMIEKGEELWLNADNSHHKEKK